MARARPPERPEPAGARPRPRAPHSRRLITQFSQLWDFFPSFAASKSFNHSFTHPSPPPPVHPLLSNQPNNNSISNPLVALRGSSGFTAGRNLFFALPKLPRKTSKSTFVSEENTFLRRINAAQQLGRIAGMIPLRPECTPPNTMGNYFLSPAASDRKEPKQNFTFSAGDQNQRLVFLIKE